MDEKKRYVVLYMDEEGDSQIYFKNSTGLQQFLRSLGEGIETLDQIPDESFDEWANNTLLVLGDDGVVKLEPLEERRVITRWGVGTWKRKQNS